MNYAVIKSGGKQYKVVSGDVILIEKNITTKGNEIRFEDVIMLGEGPNIKTKSSELASASVLGEVIEQTRGPKITIFKKKRRQNYRRKKGHRQNLTLVRIKSIDLKASKTTTTKQVSKPAKSKLKTTKNKVSQTAKKNNITKKIKSTSIKE